MLITNKSHGYVDVVHGGSHRNPCGLSFLNYDDAAYRNAKSKIVNRANSSVNFNVIELRKDVHFATILNNGLYYLIKQIRVTRHQFNNLPSRLKANE